MRIAVICALEYEINKLCELMDSAYDDEINGVSVTEGTLSGNSLVLALSGVGKVNAAATTQAIISEFYPDAVINVGLAGGCDPSLPVGTAVVATRLCYHDMDNLIKQGFPDLQHCFLTDPGIQALVKDVLSNMEVPFKEGIIATGDMFVNSDEVREDIVRRTGCLCVDMDSAAVANVCARNSVPVVSVRVLSDSANETATDDFSFSAVKYSELSAEMVSRICRSLYA